VELPPAGAGERMIQMSPVRLIVIVVIMTLTGVATFQSGCANRSADRSALAARAAEEFRRSRTAKTTKKPVICPPFGASLAPVITWTTGAHRVILSWQPGVVDSKHAAADGYCVYRGTDSKAPATEQLNQHPFPGTRCTDDSVHNGTKYFYVVRAISDGDAVSDTSKPAYAAIPNAPRSGPAFGDSPPLCRKPDNLK
jgi:hypothetical protein